MTIDLQTSSFYDSYAAQLVKGSESRRSAMLPFLLDHVSAGAAVLDVGAGSGRDVAAMLEYGLEAFGVEPNASMRAWACATHPHLVGRIRSGALPRLGFPFGDLRSKGFDAVVCSAVLMHIDQEDLPDAVAALVKQLRAAGDEPSIQPRLLFLSVPELHRSRLLDNRDQDGRRFFNHSPSRLEELLGREGMRLRRLETSEAVLQSTGALWHVLIFERF